MQRQGTRFLINVVATSAVNDKFTIVTNCDRGQQKPDAFGTTKCKSEWYGAAIYFNYALTDHSSASLRGEDFDDKNGYRTGVVDPLSSDGQKGKEATLTLADTPTKHIALRLDDRFDASNVDGAFIKDTDCAASALDVGNKQSSIALGGIYKF